MSNCNNNPRTNTAVLKENNYQFKPDTYKPREYYKLDTGWIRKEKDIDEHNTPSSDK